MIATLTLNELKLFVYLPPGTSTAEKPAVCDLSKKNSGAENFLWILKNSSEKFFKENIWWLLLLHRRKIFLNYTS